MTNYEYVVMSHGTLNDYTWEFAENMCDFCSNYGKKKCKGECMGNVCREGTLKWLEEERHDE